MNEREELNVGDIVIRYGIACLIVRSKGGAKYIVSVDGNMHSTCWFNYALIMRGATHIHRVKPYDE